MILQGPVVAIVGPTASGKSSLAEAVAERLGSEVVSVDAMQVYRGMDIGTAKTLAAERRVPLRMVDVCEPTDDYSVQLFQRDARACAQALLDAGRTPVLAGGTGLYLNAVIDRMEFPRGEKGSRARSPYEELAAEKGADEVYGLLARRDPESAALIHPNNVRRVVRALEMLDEGVSYAVHHEGLHRREAYFEARVWGLTMDRARLYARIDARVDQMMEDGLFDEVKRLAEQGLSGSLTAGQAIGYKELLDVLAGERELAEAVELIKQRSRRYAKRQLSWFRRDERVRWIDLDAVSADQARELVLNDLGGSVGTI